MARGIISGSRGTVPVAARRALKIDGINEIRAKLAYMLSATSAKAIKDVSIRAALVGRDVIKAITPVKTGLLQSAVFAAHGDPEKANVLLGVNHHIAPHAHLVEYGHAGPHAAPPKPYFRPGLVLAAPQMKTIIEEGLKDIIAKAAAD